MLRWFLRRQIAAFERTWNYDAGYIREMIDVDTRAMMAFGKVQGLSRYRKGVPLDAYRTTIARRMAGSTPWRCAISMPSWVQGPQSSAITAMSPVAQ